MFNRIRNLWNLSVLNFNASTKEGMTFYDSAGNKIELKKDHPSMKRKPATIIEERSLHEGIIDEGGDYE